MGITGLLPKLNQCLQKKSLIDYKNKVIGIDGHSWLYQIAPHVAQELFYNIPTNKLVKLFESKIKLLKSHKIKPVVVFDGEALPSKSHTNEKRRAKKDEIREKVIELLKSNRTREAKEFMKQCIYINNVMLSDVLKMLRRENVDYIISPYESDAQLCYLQKIKYIDCILTEDSDMIAYGCDKILYKLRDMCVMEFNKNLLKTVKDNVFVENLLEICILSGCDYLPSIKGIGILTAYKMMQKHGCFKKCIEEWKLKKEVPENYIEEFDRAVKTFKEQVVYDPVKKRRVYLSGKEEIENEDLFTFLGKIKIIEPEKYALGFHLKSFEGPMDEFAEKKEITNSVEVNKINIKKTKK
ncbi:Rad2 nuclease [Gurleya vavrai]